MSCSILCGRALATVLAVDIPICWKANASDGLAANWAIRRIYANEWPALMLVIGETTFARASAIPVRIYMEECPNTIGSSLLPVGLPAGPLGLTFVSGDLPFER